MVVKNVKENEDGSASISFDLTPKEVEHLLELALFQIVCSAVIDDKMKKIEEETVETINRR